MESDSAYRDSVAAHYAEHLRYLSEFDTVYVHDSVFVREAGDSVYVFKYHDRYRYRDRAVHDTVQLRDTLVVTKLRTQTITKTIKSPPQRYVPRFYKWCAAILALLILAIILYVFLRFYRNR